MNTKTIAISVIIVLTAFALYSGLIAEEVPQLSPASVPMISAHEYVTIRWDGRENSHIIRPGGKVEFVGTELRKVVAPARADERSFYMNMMMNGLTKQGYEFVAMSPEEIIMRKPVR